MTAVTPVARMVGSNRVIQGKGIVAPLGDVEASPEGEKRLRKQIVLQALEALKSEVN